MPFEDGEGEEVEVGGDAVLGADEPEGQEPAVESEGGREGEPAAREGEEPAKEGKPADDGGVRLAFNDPHVRALIEEAERTGQPIKLTAEDIAKLPMESRALLANIARMAQAEAQGRAKSDEALAKERAQVKALERQARLDRAALGKFAQADTVKAWLDELDKKAKAPADADPFSPEAIEARVNARAVELFRGFFGKLEEVAGAEKAEVERQEKAAQEAADRAAGQAYIDQHPDDFADDAMGVDLDGKPAKLMDVMRTFVQAGRTIPQAHRAATALRDQALLRATDREAAESLRAKNTRSARMAMRIPPRPSASDTAALLDYYERYPEAVKRDADPATWARPQAH